MLKRLVAFKLCLFLSAFGSVFGTFPVYAMNEGEISPQYQVRANELLEILKGSEQEEVFFASSFLEAVPLPQFRALMSQIKAQYGEPQKITRIIPATELDGTVEIQFEKATLAMRMVIDRDPPHWVIGMLVTGANVNHDSIEIIKQEMADLSGQAGFQVANISDDKLEPVESFNSDRQFAIGSAFKLYVLAELSRQIGSDTKKWNDVVALDRKSLPSGILQNWPDGTPLTLQTLATLMISVSDNSATDILIGALGRENIDNLVKQTGHAQADKMTPLLTTLESFALKMPGNDDLRKRFVAGSEGTQKRLLAEEKSRLDLDAVSITNLANAPRHIDQIEWFASPTDISRLLHFIHRQNDPVVRNILAINSIIPPGDAKRWAYLGAKGGSEPGVISFAFLVKERNGQDFAISGSWNNREAPVDNVKFQGLMNRLLNIVAEQ